MVLSNVGGHAERKDIPEELQEQWEKDRLKKAKKKKEREIARLEAALDPLVTKKGGKKSKKAMIAAARLDPSIEIPHQIVDMDTIEEQIRRFLANKDKTNMALPACNKATRKKIHTLATLFGLGSKSKDGALGRYTTLFKKNHSGKDIDERKVARLMKGFKFRASDDVIDDVWDDMFKAKSKSKGRGKGKSKEKGNSGHLKTREGDVVGHVRILPFVYFDIDLTSVPFPGSPEDRRNKHRIYDVILDGLVRRWNHRVVRGIRRSAHSGHQEDQAWVGC